MSSNSSIESTLRGASLHLVEHRRERLLELERLLDFGRADTYGYSPYSRKLGHWCSRTNLTNAGAFVFQSVGNPSRFSKIGVDARACEERNGVFGVLVEVGVEDALVHEVRVRADVEEHPAQVVELERRERVGLAAIVLLDLLPYARISPSVPGLIFAMIVKPWQAGVRG